MKSRHHALQSTSLRDTLFVILTGANDIFYDNKTQASDVIDTITHIIHTLKGSGERLCC